MEIPYQSLARLALQFGLVHRVTRHEDGTPESDTTHTVMLSLVACAFASEHPDLKLNIGLVAQLALVHDLTEVLIGDTNSFGISPEEKQKKAKAEEAAFEMLCKGFEAQHPWLVEMLICYEAQDTPEARFIRYLDKVMPKLTHMLNDCQTLREWGKTAEEVKAVHERQMSALAFEYPEFSYTVGGLLERACHQVHLQMESPSKTSKRLGDQMKRFTIFHNDALITREASFRYEATIKHVAAHHGEGSHTVWVAPAEEAHNESAWHVHESTPFSSVRLNLPMPDSLKRAIEEMDE